MTLPAKHGTAMPKNWKRYRVEVLTSHRKPVLKIEPIGKKKTVRELFKEVEGSFKCADEDLMKPESEEWGDLM